MQKNLFAKYFAVCASIVIATITILGAVFLIFASQYFKNDKYQLLRSNLERAAIVMESGAGLNEAMTRSYIQAAAQNIDATVFVANARGRIVFCTESPPSRQLGKDVPKSVLEALRKNGEYSEMGTLGGIYEDRYYTVAISLHASDGSIGGYLFASANATVQQKDFLVEMLKMFLISSLGVLALTFIAVYFITAQMVRPLRQMSAAAQKFGRGEFDVRLPVTSYDEMGQLAMALNNMAQSLSTLEVARRSFTANVSHELKTPMTTISGFIDGILDGTIPPERQRQYLQIVSDETKRLSRLVKTMLNLSRIEAGEMTIHKQSLNIVETICQVVFSFEPQIEKKALEIRGLDHGKVSIDADPDLIHQVVYNLIENAVKFVNEGGYLEFGFSRDASMTYVSVKNSGEGVSKEELPKIFDRFYKTDKSRGLDKNGVGLGLYIVRSIVNLHGGDILVKSALGDYVEFVFSIPSGKGSAKFKKNS